LTCIYFLSVRQKVQSWQLSCILSARLNLTPENSSRRKAVWGPKRLLSTLGFAFALFGTSQAAFAQNTSKLDADLQARATAGSSLRTSRVIVTLAPGGVLPASLQQYDRKGKLTTINGHVLDVPDSVLTSLSSNGNVRHVHGDRPIHASNFRTAVASGALFARTDLGYTGAGVEVAVVDSGVAYSHDDLKNVSYFKDFTNVPRLTRYDDFGHGTHVAGILAGNGKDSGGQQAGIAPGASLVVLKVLDYAGNGTVANVIAALEWIAANYNQNGHNIRVVNLSIGAPVTESYDVDPLTVAAKRLVDLGITVVAAAGNGGNDSAGHPLWGAISAPANAPWVLTVGASSTEGTLTRADDKVATFSSRGPTLIDRAAKPDLVASGVGTVSTIATEASLYSINSRYLVSATSLLLRTKPYMVLSGTSMSAPVVSGTVALMLQANPNLTPNLIKAILQYTAEVYPGYDPLEEGAGFLNSLGAVRLAKFYATAHSAGDAVPIEPIWGRQIFWGNHRVAGGFMLPTANAWNNGVQWGAAKTLGEAGDNIVWGTVCGSGDCGDNIVWGTHTDGDNIVWGTFGDGDNIVWGTVCGGGDCGDNIVWGTHDGGDNIVWGTSDGDNIVWGTTDGDNIVWGTVSSGDTTVWGTATNGDNIVWGTVSEGDNIVWGTVTDGDNIVWGTLTRSQPRINLQNNPSYGWFLNQSNRAPWMRQEFGEVIANRTSGQ
jgi:serine protease AprX